MPFDGACPESASRHTERVLSLPKNRDPHCPSVPSHPIPKSFTRGTSVACEPSRRSAYVEAHTAGQDSLAVVGEEVRWRVCLQAENDERKIAGRIPLREAAPRRFGQIDFFRRHF